MRIDNPHLSENSQFKNLILERGAVFPEKASDGELFRLKGNTKLADGLYVFEDGQWNPLARREPWIQVGTSSSININSNNVVTLPWNQTYLNDEQSFTLMSNGIKVLRSGRYEVSYNVGVRSDSSNRIRNATFYVTKQDGVQIPRSLSYLLTLDITEVESVSTGSRFVVDLKAGDVLQLKVLRSMISSVLLSIVSGTLLTIAESTTFTVQRLGN